jgi:hypothetical protein
VTPGEKKTVLMLNKKQFGGWQETRPDRFQGNHDCLKCGKDVRMGSDPFTGVGDNQGEIRLSHVNHV